MPSASRAPDDGAAEACLRGTSSSGRRRLPGAARQRAPQQGPANGAALQPLGSIRIPLGMTTMPLSVTWKRALSSSGS